MQIINHEYTHDMTLRQWKVSVSPSTEYGCYEHQITGDGGELWFDEKMSLIDYDGQFELPPAVITVLRMFSFTVSREFE